MISNGKYFTILFLALLMLGAFSRLPEVRRWWQSALRNRGNFFLYILCMALPFVVGTAAADTSVSDIGMIRWIRFGLVVLLLTITILQFMRAPFGRTPIGAAAWAMIIYALICIASAFWSSEPLITSWKGLEILTLVLAAILICGNIRSAEDFKVITGMIGIASLFFCLTLILGLIIAPEAAIRYEHSGFSLRGVAPPINSNSVSQWGVVLASVSLVIVLDKRKLRGQSLMWILFALGLAVALLGHGRTSLIAFAGTAGIILLFGKHYAMTALVGFMVIIILMFSAMQSGIVDFMLRGQSTELFFSMSNRLHYWELGWEAIKERPLFGYGYYTGTRDSVGFTTLDSAYLEALIGIGFIGSIPFFLAPLLLIYRFYRTNPWRKQFHRYSVIWLQIVAIFLILMMRSITSMAFGGLHPNTVLFMFAAVSAAALLHVSIHEQTQETTAAPAARQHRKRILKRV